jgi:hypothetical protein
VRQPVAEILGDFARRAVEFALDLQVGGDPLGVGGRTGDRAGDDQGDRLDPAVVGRWPMRLALEGNGHAAASTTAPPNPKGTRPLCLAWERRTGGPAQLRNSLRQRSQEPLV